MAPKAIGWLVRKAVSVVMPKSWVSDLAKNWQTSAPMMAAWRMR